MARDARDRRAQGGAAGEPRGGEGGRRRAGIGAAPSSRRGDLGGGPARRAGSADGSLRGGRPDGPAAVGAGGVDGFDGLDDLPAVGGRDRGGRSPRTAAANAASWSRKAVGTSSARSSARSTGPVPSSGWSTAPVPRATRIVPRSPMTVSSSRAGSRVLVTVMWPTTPSPRSSRARTSVSTGRSPRWAALAATATGRRPVSHSSRSTQWVPMLMNTPPPEIAGSKNHDGRLPRR